LVLAANATATVSADATVRLDGVQLEGGSAAVRFNPFGSGSINLGGVLAGTGSASSYGSTGNLILGGVTLDGSLAFDHGGLTRTSGEVSTTGAQSYSGAVVLDADTTFNSGPGITFGGGVGGMGNLEVSAGGDLADADGRRQRLLVQHQRQLD